MKVYSFPRGGIVYKDPVAPKTDQSVTAFLPGLSVIPLVQHTGAKAFPIVAVGDVVKEGALIGRGQGPGSANIHATVPGRVIKAVSWKMGDEVVDALVIRMEGAFEKLGKKQEFFSWENNAPFELQRLIAEYGIVEMEGSGRPIAEMLASLNPTRETSTLVVRCVFDDPWLRADYVLCHERFQAVLDGSIIAARAGRINRIVFAVSQPEEHIGSMFLSQAARYTIPASLVLVGSQYPQRNRRELEIVLQMYEKRESVSLGSLLILGPSTLAAIHDAVRLHKPILDRYIAVGGSAVKEPRVLKVRIGTRIGEIFAECGGFVDKPRHIGIGSPLLGRPVANLDEPVIKSTYGVFAMQNMQGSSANGQRCINCGECRRVCPVGLDPEELYKRSQLQDNREQTRAGECHGCGCCEVVCPSQLPLSSTIVHFSGKGK